jgi:hypothetical protein
MESKRDFEKAMRNRYGARWRGGLARDIGVSDILVRASLREQTTAIGCVYAILDVLASRQPQRIGQ